MNLEEKRIEIRNQLIALQNQLSDINHQINEEKAKSLNLKSYLNKTIVITKYDIDDKDYPVYIKPISFTIRYNGIEFYGSIYRKGIYNHNSTYIVDEYTLNSIKINDLDILDQFIKDVREDGIYDDNTNS